MDISNECCLSGMYNMSDQSIHLICADLPYGSSEMGWDSVIPLELLWKQMKRVLKPYGTIVLFGKQPFSSKLIMSNMEMFKYSLVWKKSKTGNFAQAPYRFLCEHEDILIFSKAGTSHNAKHKMTYNPQSTRDCLIQQKGKTGKTHHRKNRSTQQDYMQKKTNYPRSILSFANEGRLHPTQKPLKLISYLIKTFSHENDTVLDVCFGSGTTAIACLDTNRRFIGFEKENEYFNIAKKRIDNHPVTNHTNE